MDETYLRLLGMVEKAIDLINEKSKARGLSDQGMANMLKAIELKMKLLEKDEQKGG